MTVRFETEQYEFSHGKRPRGFGWWMIEVDGKDIIEFRGTITELKKNILRLCEEKGIKNPFRFKVLA